MKFAIASLFLVCAHAQNTIGVIPAVITNCAASGLGKAQIVWSAPSLNGVQVRVGGPTGTSLTGPASSSGTASTGAWITDGMVFVLVDAAGQELARASARLGCVPDYSVIDTALGASAWFPLAVGNQWVYRINDRVVTSRYSTVRIDRAEFIGSQLWFVAVEGTAETRYRHDDQGRVFRLSSATATEQLYLDPTPNPDKTAFLPIVSRLKPITIGLGVFPEGLAYDQVAPLGEQRGSFVRGIGLVSSTDIVLAGSNGGFGASHDLVWARISGNLIFAPADALSVSAESPVLDVTGQNVTNCAIPCYFAACGFGPAVDPPNTYKPCFQARVTAPATPAAILEVSLVDSNGKAGSPMTQPAQGVTFVQLPLYSAPNVPLPAGNYQVRARLLNGATELQSSTVSVQLK